MFLYEKNRHRTILVPLDHPGSSSSHDIVHVHGRRILLGVPIPTDFTGPSGASRVGMQVVSSAAVQYIVTNEFKGARFLPRAAWTPKLGMKTNRLGTLASRASARTWTTRQTPTLDPAVSWTRVYPTSAGRASAALRIWL